MGAKRQVLVGGFQYFFHLDRLGRRRNRIGVSISGLEEDFCELRKETQVGFHSLPILSEATHEIECPIYTNLSRLVSQSCNTRHGKYMVCWLMSKRVVTEGMNADWCPRFRWHQNQPPTMVPRANLAKRCRGLFE
ncbi:hypothetical protein SUGI_0769840 [Cryptomeria japonica]|nr:hypothetical protein SUGI_0769840 [Cryptomeria japonica]